MTSNPLVVDNRVFLLGLDELFREAMKRHERDELLRCARETARTLSIDAVDVPIEGYYSEDERLTEYFRLVRGLQGVPRGRETEVAGLASFQRLKQVIESPIFGPPFDGQFLFSSGEDALAIALKVSFPDWTVENLTNAAFAVAVGSADFSLVTLAALSRDAVALAALRESVVLYAVAVAGSAMESDSEYDWEVDPFIQRRADQFVETFNRLFEERLPSPVPENAKDYWIAFQKSDPIGRCARIGFNNRVEPVRHYHWAIDQDAKNRTFVRDFWDTEIWTTARYRAKFEL